MVKDKDRISHIFYNERDFHAGMFSNAYLGILSHGFVYAIRKVLLIVLLSSLRKVTLGCYIV